LCSLVIYRWIATRAVDDKQVWVVRRKLNRELWGYIWAPAWRSGLGILLTFGTIQGSAVLYAQFAPPIQVASYLLAVRLMQGLVSLGNVPFYTKMPTLARYYAGGRVSELVIIARIGMFWANWILLLGILLIGFLGQEILKAIGSSTQLIHATIWWMLGLAYMAERIGAMFLQLYTTTNHSVWHIANGISGLLMLCLMPLLYGKYGIIGLPLGMLLGYALFYLPYSIIISYRAFKLHLSRYEITGILLPVAILFLLLTVSIY
jgi:O-antigen/teichoic acid export membrane protein